MNREIFIKFVSAFLPGKKLRTCFRNRMTISLLKKSNDIFIDPHDVNRVRLIVKGKNNVIHIGKLKAGKGVLEIHIAGDGNRVELGENVSVVCKLGIFVGQRYVRGGEVSCTSVKIGNNNGFMRSEIHVYTSNSSVWIGSGCSFSYDVLFYHTDGHPIIDLGTGIVCNRVRTMEIGDHVWVGAGTCIMKNVKIPNDCIVGMHSVVTRQFERSHCAIAGNPARCVTAEGRELSWLPYCEDYIANSLSRD